MSKPGTTDKEDDDGDFTPDTNDDAFSQEEKDAIARMERETPMPTTHEGGDPPKGEEGEEGEDGEGEDEKPRPKKAAAKASGEEDGRGKKAKAVKEEEADPDLEEGEEEITIDAQGKGHDPSGKYVSKSALVRVKGDNKTLKETLEKERQETARILGRLQLLTEVINTKPGEKGEGDKDTKKAPANPWDEEDINPVDDVVAALEQQRRRERYNYDQHKTSSKTLTERDQQSSMVNSYIADSRRLINEQVKKGEVVEVDGQKLPVYQAAYLHLVKVRHAQLEAIGVSDKAERDKIIADEELGLVREAASRKLSPAETVFAFAKASGFTIPKPAAKVEKKTDDEGEEEDDDNAGKTEKQIAAEKKLNAVNKGKQASQTLSGKGGKAYGGLTSQQIIAMDDDEFASLVEKMGEDAINRMLGAGA